MNTSRSLEIPARLAALYESYDRTFGAALPELVSHHLDRWGLVRDGPADAGEASLVLPVRRADGTRAVLKLQPPRQETTAAIIGLRTWNGAGAVRLLDHDPESSTMLLERLDGARTLTALEDDDEATAILADLLARLVSVPAPEGLRALGDIATDMLTQTPEAAASLTDPSERRLLRGWASAVAELADEPGDRLLHWDLHYDNVLAADREPWLAIDPEPLAGDPGFDLWPALDSRWDDVVAKGDTRRILLRRFDILTEALTLDRPRSTIWTLARLLQNELWNIEDGSTTLAPSSVAMAEALGGRARFVRS
ncbi:aminoglycoside phosphotransferase family protein [Streptomyces sp. NPDC057654]|uniref:aminoglycoside phosphotransferase family protein n=1 Tax=Streptomyces sp. NPDC057654 TaxID=3346196 RepID=UPI0036B07092